MDGDPARLILSREKRKPSGPPLKKSIGLRWAIRKINQERDGITPFTSWSCEVSAYSDNPTHLMVIKPSFQHGYSYSPTGSMVISYSGGSESKHLLTNSNISDNSPTSTVVINPNSSVIFSIIQFLIIHRHRYYALKSNKRQIFLAISDSGAQIRT